MSALDRAVWDALNNALPDIPIWPVVARDQPGERGLVVLRISEAWRVGVAVRQNAVSSYRLEARGSDWLDAGELLSAAIASIMGHDRIAVAEIAGGQDDYDETTSVYRRFATLTLRRG